MTGGDADSKDIFAIGVALNALSSTGLNGTRLIYTDIQYAECLNKRSNDFVVERINRCVNPVSYHASSYASAALPRRFHHPRMGELTDGKRKRLLARLIAGDINLEDVVYRTQRNPNSSYFVLVL
ncbi:alpha/beta hydrolase [Anopheles sinensis]|uniref:Alpha/beta hydrolase n=1 Tax=Anopheles sinensis TaxID=74873 RepID=A0A084VKN0_ANOSI|nr:alpha/beta hydrolase [Anopheles sinensis]